MSRRLVVAELTAAGLASLMVAVTIARPAWIELVLQTDPDHRSGLFEILLVGGLTAVGAGASLAARAHRHLAAAVAEPATRTTAARACPTRNSRQTSRG
jgi:hypothetical protein